MQLIGRLTHDPGPHATPNGTVPTTFRFAVDHARRQLANYITVKACGGWPRWLQSILPVAGASRWGSLEHREGVVGYEPARSVIHNPWKSYGLARRPCVVSYASVVRDD